MIGQDASKQGDLYEEAYVVRIEPRVHGRVVHDRLDDLAQAFLGRMVQVRALEEIARPVTDSIVDAIRSAPSSTVLVHGPAGFGKSEVLAAAIARLRKDHVPKEKGTLLLSVDRRNVSDVTLTSAEGWSQQRYEQVTAECDDCWPRPGCPEPPDLPAQRG